MTFRAIWDDEDGSHGHIADRPTARDAWYAIPHTRASSWAILQNRPLRDGGMRVIATSDECTPDIGGHYAWVNALKLINEHDGNTGD